ncbi:MAG: hypothetical protein II504_05075, partial [Clostridia bacterium]|nr:hypothetical protein [Clostridia bacterium]
NAIILMPYRGRLQGQFQKSRGILSVGGKDMESVDSQSVSSGKNIKKTMLRGIKGCTLNIYPEKTACSFFRSLVSKKKHVQIKENTTCH